MFVKKSQNTQNGNCYQITQSYRLGKNKNSRTKILANITKLRKPLIDKISLLFKSKTAIQDLSSFFGASYIFGPTLFLYFFMKRLGIINALEIIPPINRFLLIAVIMNRILEPRSKLGSISWIKKTCLPLLFGIKETHFLVS